MKKNGFTPGFGVYRYGEDFWPGAIPNPDGVAAKLLRGTSVSVFGLRRIGKSSLLAESRERLRKKGANVLWIDLETHDSLSKALAALLKSISSNEEHIVKDLIGWIENIDFFPSDLKTKVAAIANSKIDSAIDSDIDHYAEALFKQIGYQIEEDSTDNNPIIIFDEITVMIQNEIERASEEDRGKIVAKMNTFLGTLRYWRTKDVGVSMAICGSTSMDWLQRKYGVKEALVNDCVPIYVREMKAEDARELLEACIRSNPPKNWSENCTDALLAQLPAFYPGVIQLAFSVIEDEDASLDAINGPLRTVISDALEDKYYKQFTQKIANYSKDEQIRIQNLFEDMSRVETESVSYASALQTLDKGDTGNDSRISQLLVYDLVSDGFIKSNREIGVSFSSGLVSAWLKSR